MSAKNARPFLAQALLTQVRCQVSVFWWTIWWSISKFWSSTPKGLVSRGLLKKSLAYLPSWKISLKN